MSGAATAESPTQIAARMAAEFGLGAPTGHTRLGGSTSEVIKLTTTRGTFVLKPVYREFEVRLYAQVAAALNARGIRQARLARTAGGSLVSTCGRSVQEFLPWPACLSPTAAQSTAVMRHLADYDAALAGVAVPAAVSAADTVWNRVARPGYLLQRLPDLLSRFGPPDADQAPVAAALGYLEAALPQVRRLPRQIVHGDIGPDNVLMDGGQVGAIIDFTPFAEPVLFGLAGALYWYHVHGYSRPDVAQVRASVGAYGERRQLTDEELAVWPVMLLRESLRRLATPLALAERGSEPEPASLRRRYLSVLALVRSWTELHGSGLT